MDLDGLVTIAFRHADEAGFDSEAEPQWPTPEACADLFASLPARLSGRDDLADDRLATGLRFLLSGERCDFAYRLRDGAMPFARRRAAIAAIGELYAGVFDARCGREPIALRDDGSLLDRTVFMLWDVSPLSYWPESGGEPARLGREALVTMLAGVLAIGRSPVCLESALHGLGHLVGSTGGASGAVIRAWLKTAREIPAETREYAVAAAEGTIP